MFYKLEELKPGDLPPVAIALGVFDGVHRGHQALLAEASRAAAERGDDTISAALTFDPHPAAVFSPGRVPPMLGTLEERAALLNRYGAQAVIVAHFDRALAAQTPEEFVRRVLHDVLRVRVLVVGEDFRFGCDRTGDIHYLRAAGERYGFVVRSVAPVFVQGVPARSTGIRHMISGGQIEEAARLLGRSYTLSGEVVQGKQLGRTIGYPTANVASAPGVLVPGAGVYACYVHLEDGSRHRAAVSVGVNVTVSTTAPRTVEAFILDEFSRDIYGQRITVEFVSRLRGMERFDSLDALKEQIARDVEEAAAHLDRPHSRNRPVRVSP